MSEHGRRVNVIVKASNYRVFDETPLERGTKFAKPPARTPAAVTTKHGC